MKLIFSHPTANANVRAAAEGFLEAGMLSEFRTAIASFPGDALDRLATIGPFSEFRRRQFNPLLKSVTRTSPWLELGRQGASKAGFSRLTRHEKGIFCIDAVYRGLDSWVAGDLKKAARKGVGAVYAYEDGARSSFRAARALGMECLYELPTGYWRTARALLGKEKERYPQWASTIKGFRDSEAKLARKDEELKLADRIFVASSFTAKSLQDYPGKLAPVEVIPYGFPPVSESRVYPSFAGRRPLRILFVGSLSQRKGLADLFEVSEKLGRHVELTLVGRKSTEDCAPLNEALKKHRWIPSLPHTQVLQLMHAHDVLVFPSLFEGFGLVISEAMSQGTPVITTERTAGPDLIEDGRNGWLVKAGSAHALQQAIESLLLMPEKIARIGQEARETARNRPWKTYRRELAEAIMRSRHVGTELSC